MVIETPPFIRQKVGDEPKFDGFNIRLNPEERKALDELKKILEQPKDATCFKQLAAVGAKVVLEPRTRELLAIIFSNKRRNRRLGIVEFEVE